MLDAIREFAPVATARSGILDRLGLAPGNFLVATLHRAENTTPGRLPPLLAALAAAGSPARPVVLPLHPRTANVMREAGIALPEGDALRIVQPLGYLDMIALVAHARIVMTDSGGLQKEAFFLGRPCVTLREETEWVETVSGGGNIVAGTDPRRIRDAVKAWDARLASGEPDFSAAVREAFGDGTAADRVLGQAMDFMARRTGA
jgi:UDP-N-acetylglucosamine 2-epimerase